MRTIPLAVAPLTIACIVALSGCTSAPERPPIVLNKPSPPPHVIKRTSPATTTTAVPLPPLPPGGAVPLSPSEKEELFRAFEDYLNEERARK